MVVIPPGIFLIGSPVSEAGRDLDEGPQQHEVSIARPFAVGKFEVTFEEWDTCVRDGGCSWNPFDQGWGRGRMPVISLSWNDAKQYTGWLSRKTGKNYSLLTEAQWEYAARAGTTTAFSTGMSISPNQANYDSRGSYQGSPIAQSVGKTQPVGSYPANAFGLHDMHGNVWEHTEDCWYSNNIYTWHPGDGSAYLFGDCSVRVMRGGSWGSHPHDLRSARRGGIVSAERWSVVGFRVARTD